METLLSPQEPTTAVPTNPLNDDALPPRIEIETLVHELDEYGFGDSELAAYLNDEWEILNITVTTHVEDFNDRPKAIHTRIVTLHKLIDDAPTPEKAVPTHEQVAAILDATTAEGGTEPDVVIVPGQTGEAQPVDQAAAWVPQAVLVS